MQELKNKDIRKIDEVYNEKKQVIWLLKNIAFLTFLILFDKNLTLEGNMYALQAPKNIRTWAVL